MRGIRGLSQLSTRLYAAKASPKLDVAEPAKFLPQEVQVSKLLSGLDVASLENYSPASRICVLVNAGSRFETTDNLGVTHLIRLAANLTTKGASAFKICRGVEAVGGSLSVSCSRENIVYTVDCLRDHIDTVMEYLINVTTAPEFRPWEVSELSGRVKLDKALAAQTPQIGVLELLHAAAYKNALSNSLYCPDYNIGKITPDQMHSFVQSNFTSERMVLVGLGVDHDSVKQIGQQFLNIRSGKGGVCPKAVYHGGELRHQTGSGLTHTMVAIEGPSITSADVTAFGVLQHVLGVGQRVKRASGNGSRLSHAIGKVTALPFDVSAFNVNYTDSGLFGIYTIAQANAAKDVVKAAVDQVADVAIGNLSEADLSKAKNQLLADYLMSLESSDGLADSVLTQVISEETYSSPEVVSQKINAVSSEDVVTAANKFMSGKKTLVSSGDMVNAPFLDDL